MAVSISDLHLLFLPRSAGGPHLFLWSRDLLRAQDLGGAPAEAMRELMETARPRTARVITDAGAVEAVSGLAIPLAAAVPRLAALGADQLDRIPASVAAWSFAAKLAFDLIARERVVPLPLPGPKGGEVRWGVSLSIPGDAERVRRLARALPPAAHAVPAADGAARRGTARATRVWAPSTLLTEFLDEAADALVRQATGPGVAAVREANGGQRGSRGSQRR